MSRTQSHVGALRERHAFTLIEVLVVIAIIGILASVVLISLRETGAKGNRAAFAEAATGAIPGLWLACNDHAPLVVPANTKDIQWGVAVSEHCGAIGNNTFVISVSNARAFAHTGLGACRVFVTNAGVVFDANGSGTLDAADHAFTVTDCP